MIPFISWMNPRGRREFPKMLWDVVFLAIIFAVFLGIFWLCRWGNDKRPPKDKDIWKFTNPGSGGA